MASSRFPTYPAAAAATRTATATAMNVNCLALAWRAALRANPRRALCHSLVTGACLLAGAHATAQTLKPERLTDEQLVRLQKVALSQGSSIAIPPGLVGVLHFTPAQVTPTLRQVSFQLDDGVKHGFARLNDGSGYFLFRRAPDGVSAYHVDKDFTLVDAAHNFSNDRFVALPAKPAQDGINAEIVAWERVLSPKGVAPPPGPKPAADAPPGAPPRLPTPGAMPAAPAK